MRTKTWKNVVEGLMLFLIIFGIHAINRWIADAAEAPVATHAVNIKQNADNNSTDMVKREGALVKREVLLASYPAARPPEIALRIVTPSCSAEDVRVWFLRTTCHALAGDRHRSSVEMLKMINETVTTANLFATTAKIEAADRLSKEFTLDELRLLEAGRSGEVPDAENRALRFQSAALHRFEETGQAAIAVILRQCQL